MLLRQHHTCSSQPYLFPISLSCLKAEKRHASRCSWHCHSVTNTPAAHPASVCHQLSLPSPALLTLNSTTPHRCPVVLPVTFNSGTLHHQATALLLPAVPHLLLCSTPWKAASSFPPASCIPASSTLQQKQSLLLCCRLHILLPLSVPPPCSFVPTRILRSCLKHLASKPKPAALLPPVHTPTTATSLQLCPHANLALLPQAPLRLQHTHPDHRAAAV